MKLVITAADQGTDANIDPHFGRCPYFIYADTETGTIEAETNNGRNASGGAGIAAAQQVAGKTPDAVLTGQCGPNAFRVLEAAGIKVYTSVSGTVAEAIESYKSGALKPVSESNAAPHSGMNRGA